MPSYPLDIPNPRTKPDVWNDILAGLSVAGVLLPEAVAYAAIAGVPPVHALLAALVGLCVYPLFGSSRFAIVAPTSSAAAIFASAVGAGGPAMGFGLVLLTGALFLLAGLLRGGFLGAFISRPVLRGFAWGLTVTIILKQVPHLAGVHVAGSQAIQIVAGLAGALQQLHGPSVGLGVGALLLWLGLHHGLRRFIFVPQSLIVLGLGVAVASAADLQGLGIAQVGKIELQSLRPQLPELTTEHWLRAAEIAPALLLILFAESWGSVRSLALQIGDRVDANREMLAFGLSNMASGLLQGLPVGAGFSAAAANYAAGSRSKWAGVIAALSLALLLWLARDALALLPLPVLAAVVIGILSHNLWPKAMVEGLRLGGDAWLALMAASGVLLFGVLFGMLLAVGSSLLLALRRFSQPIVVELGKLPGTRDYQDCIRHPEAIRIPRVLIVRTEEPLFFANAEQVFHVVMEWAARNQAHTVLISLEVCDDLDATATEALAECAARLRQWGVRLALARVKDRVRDTLSRGGLVTPSDGITEIFWSVDDAAQAMIGKPPLQPERRRKSRNGSRRQSRRQ
ncbi:SulP family inorganic anion transporter [Zoogloea sp.]|uniref:SulP family inorganic anion transporter n=1 Tax=Zoogloea sp. TaxID=49181 RepID=UPI0014159882|nr:MAG: SulP family inorganic anion transporter [Zoogloea sp.]